MRIMVGTSNLNRSVPTIGVRTASERLTRALLLLQQETETEEKPFHLLRALPIGPPRGQAPKPTRESNLRRDLLAEAKVAMALREWKDR